MAKPTSPSQLIETLTSALPPEQSRPLPPEAQLLRPPEDETAADRFFHRSLSGCPFPTNLYDRSGAPQVRPLVPGAAPDFPDPLRMPAQSHAGVAFVVAGEALFLLYDRIDRWEDAPAILSRLAVLPAEGAPC
ncbi:hypothetical protein KM176_18985 [Pseudooceanicola sp. CBS1P-1]|uniref:Uncharacterized protein n=1 Tax=Pseudooceanicola albus TaxID=2692189 RepID=A0A6L7G674_9RHOB|nr:MULTISPECIES: hypothetical protein [Pseudooceanicola]MBT9385964.1 hypothetical protein [Pseudooceanicola endophyticus]MXN19615.1 hypothetical protein [Pseudooceanicola albus]